MRNVEKRWKCPVCNRTVKPDELILDSLFAGICESGREPRRMRLQVQDDQGVWEALPDEELVGEESADEEEDQPSEAKRPRLMDDEEKSKEHVVLDLLLMFFSHGQ
jgi:hypothetical protein